MLPSWQRKGRAPVDVEDSLGPKRACRQSSISDMRGCPLSIKSPYLSDVQRILCKAAQARLTSGAFVYFRLNSL